MTFFWSEIGLGFGEPCGEYPQKSIQLISYNYVNSLPNMRLYKTGFGTNDFMYFLRRSARIINPVKIVLSQLKI